MTPRPKVFATDEELKSFDWLPLEQWSVDTLFNYFGVEGKKLCKLCDEWSSVGVLSEHVRKHKNARLALKKKEREIALERAREARKLKKEERDRERKQN